MKVTITHSIDLEEVPEKAADLLMPAEDKLAYIVGWLSGLSCDLHNNKITAEMACLSLDRVRREMAECDNIIAEVEAIMSGVANYEQQKDTTPPTTPPPQSTSDIDRAFEELERE
jgi:hypothetical protein